MKYNKLKFTYQGALVFSLQKIKKDKVKLVDINEMFRDKNYIGSYYSTKYKKRISLVSSLSPCFDLRYSTFYIFGKVKMHDSVLLDFEDFEDIFECRKILLK